MAVKFIDRSRKNESVSDEIVARCSCGCGFLSVMAADYPCEEEQIRGILFTHLGFGGPGKKNMLAKELFFANPEHICIIGNLFRGLNKGTPGIVEDSMGKLLLISHDDDGSLCMGAFYNQKAAKKYMKNPLKGEKYLSWDVVLEEKEAKKFVEAFDKILRSTFSDVIQENNSENSEENTQKNTQTEV